MVKGKKGALRFLNYFVAIYLIIVGLLGLTVG